MKTCPLRFPILEPGAEVGGVFGGWALSKPPRYLTCALEEGHQGPHKTPDGIAWQFIPGVQFFADEPAGHVNCRCELATVESHQRLPAWWVAERCDEVFGPVSPALFFELEARK